MSYSHSVSYEVLYEPSSNVVFVIARIPTPIMNSIIMTTNMIPKLPIRLKIERSFLLHSQINIGNKARVTYAVLKVFQSGFCCSGGLVEEHKA